MKIVAAVTSYNESLFLNEVLTSIHDFVDEIVITDVAIKDVIDLGGSLRSDEKTTQIIKNWKQKSSKVHTILPENPPKTFAELMMPGLQTAKELDGDWLFTCYGDEIWPKNSISPMRKFLSSCDRSGILGVNVTMNYFAPDFWHYKDFYNPRLAKITPDACMPFTTGDPLAWPELGIWQTMDYNNVPEKVRKANIDYPKSLRTFHYSCIGYERVKLKYDFYQKHENNTGSELYSHFLKNDWDYFRKQYKLFTGKHPDIMLSHPLYNERLY